VLNTVLNKNVWLLNVTVSDVLTQITYQSFYPYWNMLELGILWNELKNSQTGHSFKALPLN
jgi:hypothetical protein